MLWQQYSWLKQVGCGLIKALGVLLNPSGSARFGAKLPASTLSSALAERAGPRRQALDGGHPVPDLKSGRIRTCLDEG